jgi:hypothetical protein
MDFSRKDALAINAFSSVGNAISKLKFGKRLEHWFLLLNMKNLKN